ncbi:hypothetical protein ACOMICROBIO_LMKGKHOH_03940 [Vibrio sp. B1FIG11]|uniref:hypothetical protein n=1 Tax=Vibrio sp. B1FIG11 TaxID=2751177 RepID=UPI001AF05F03|nr:hypothetical protein [Vibrio sp. B1FIG11]CAD7826905.1 hypothetical protein ACOMICROBIO_LMKGKHOH_03940 [Vibrio sp. B1FIG11]CAE6962068.1 hypothetical protein ACOMICROBIO_LMKGKHOH_03940 [Vibrio sp. B1FIG11]
MNFKHSTLLIAATLFGSSAFADTDLVQGGQGQVQLIGEITATTCVVSIDDTSLRFSVPPIAWNAASAGVTKQVSSKISLSSCQGKDLSVKITPKASVGSHGKFDNVETTKAGYQLFLTDDVGAGITVTDGRAGGDGKTKFVDFTTAAGSTFNVDPTADSASFNVQANILKTATDSTGDLTEGTKLNSSYTYTVTYR